jgi:signal transduction histidine kinase
MEVVKKMAAGLAHDFNNILTAILGNADLLLYELRPQDPACSGITAIKESAERASKVTGKLLTLSQGQVIHPETLNLNDLIAGMEKRLKDVLGGNITYDPVLEPDLRSVKADRLQVEQVILNLVSNAKEAMPEGGGLRISTENTHLDEKYSHLNPEVIPGGYTLVSVSDTGIGIPPRMMGHLFEPFFTVKPSGRGLGLALVYSIVKQAGGHIAVSSKEEKGTTVKIYFPALAVPPPSSTS